MKKVLIAATAFAMAAAFTACSDDSSSAGPSCEVQVTATGVSAIQHIPGLGDYPTTFEKVGEDDYSDGFNHYTLEEAKAAANENCALFESGTDM